MHKERNAREYGQIGTRKDVKTRSGQTGSFFNFDKIFILFYRDVRFSKWNEKSQISRKSSAFSTIIRRRKPSWSRGRKMCESARTYVRFSCRSFASVSGAAVLLPQCSRSSLSRPPSPAAIVVSPGSSADLRTKRSRGGSLIRLGSQYNFRVIRPASHLRRISRLRPL